MSYYQVPGTWLSTTGTRYLVPGTWCSSFCQTERPTTILHPQPQKSFATEKLATLLYCSTVGTTSTVSGSIY